MQQQMRSVHVSEEVETDTRGSKKQRYTTGIETSKEQDEKHAPTTEILPPPLPYSIHNRHLDERIHRATTQYTTLPVDLLKHHKTPPHKRYDQTRRKAAHHERN